MSDGAEAGGNTGTLHGSHSNCDSLCLFYHTELTNCLQLTDFNEVTRWHQDTSDAMVLVSPMTFQTTIERPVSTSGVGLHTAVKSHLRLVPAPADTGIVFRRVDLDNFEIEAHVRNVARVSYATSLMKKGVLLSTTEHLLAALYSCGVEPMFTWRSTRLNCRILDGSSQPFIEMLEHAGVRRLRKRRRYLKVLKPLEFSDGGRRIGIYPANDFRVHCFVEYAKCRPSARRKLKCV